jgi:cytochrome c556
MRTLILALLALAVFPGDTPSADKKPAPGSTAKLMAEKLKSSQALLEGLATNDFAKVEKSAENLIEISKAAEWGAYKTPQYEIHMNNFRRSAETVIRKAKDKNLDGATLAYVDMTVTCVRCHQHCREVRDTALPPLDE